MERKEKRETKENKGGKGGEEKRRGSQHADLFPSLKQF